ncbi:flagellar basal body L-ring protein FlgH [Acuticoccus sp. M5D2P5]|uniref:flagellar basal body L-ring protein FlgH n=1 Tax=Acuticoccus kalidii TaxID=2910977 RepID=UPI001F310520|nr:flagellar basal body L-ring protein FlgH [Acuticoccus kalidii]MCF3932467.1 flagellar basal body L-ring protein FlgH [Acuticoccus kalidii]
MRGRPLLAVGLACATVAGCAEGQPLGTPALSPIGEGLIVTRTALPVTIPEPGFGNPTSLYGRRNRDLLTDVRARNVGDTLTVVIEIDDKAEFDNESKRERQADTDFDIGLFGSARGFDGPENSGELAGNLGIGSSSRYRGTGGIDRSEKLNLRVAVVVTEVMANGNLLISGTQEIRVNDEIRVLKLAGLVNPLDVSQHNIVGYEKIAEARISYGGRGRQSEIQSPNWGQQIYDKVVPF